MHREFLSIFTTKAKRQKSLAIGCPLEVDCGHREAKRDLSCTAEFLGLRRRRTVVGGDLIGNLGGGGEVSGQKKWIFGGQVSPPPNIHHRDTWPILTGFFCLFFLCSEAPLGCASIGQCCTRVAAGRRLCVLRRARECEILPYIIGR